MTEISKVCKGVPFTDSLENYLDIEHVSLCQFLFFLNIADIAQYISRLNIKAPITPVLDNARYQKCKIVWDLAETLNIELLYLPHHSPNLNLIERLWKFVKKQCLYSKYYSEFKDFKKAINDCLDQTDTTYKQ
jgi:hypothetical protein